MKTWKNLKGRFRDQKGVSIILVAILMLLFIGFAALAIDLGHLYLVRNELQNAADAAALAGARFLYNNNGTAVNEGSNQIAYDTAVANKSEKLAVDVHWSGGNTGDIERGHWSFATKTFTPNDSLVPVNLWNVSDAELDANLDFINAVRVKVRRQDTPAASFFARVFSFADFILTADAVAYIGFSGTLAPGEVDEPIGICQQYILQNGEYNCNIGRMINSGGNISTVNTGGWTNFTQPCSGAANPPTVRPLLCASGNPDMIYLGEGMTMINGMVQNVFDGLFNCWISKTNQTSIWSLTLPVIDCGGNVVNPCETVVGAVTVNIVWITDKNDPHYNQAPYQMADWSSTNPDGTVRWASFVQHFHLQNVDGSPAPYQQKAIYFLPSCEPHELTGRTGGHNFGMLAKIPVLVK